MLSKYIQNTTRCINFAYRKLGILTDSYKSKVIRAELDYDEAQLSLLRTLDRVINLTTIYSNSGIKEKKPKGFYLWGPVGTGIWLYLL